MSLEKDLYGEAFGKGPLEAFLKLLWTSNPAQLTDEMIRTYLEIAERVIHQRSGLRAVFPPRMIPRLRLNLEERFGIKKFATDAWGTQRLRRAVLRKSLNKRLFFRALASEAPLLARLRIAIGAAVGAYEIPLVALVILAIVALAMSKPVQGPKQLQSFLDVAGQYGCSPICGSPEAAHRTCAELGRRLRDGAQLVYIFGDDGRPVTIQRAWIERVQSGSKQFDLHATGLGSNGINFGGGGPVVEQCYP